MEKTISIALAGNPNSGKTTAFNALTGSTARVGNWPGVTVEKKEGRLKDKKDVFIQDLPGIYSLSPYTQEEVITRNYLTEERPDAIIDIVDATNIERNLYLTSQLTELGIPVVIALNMSDLLKKNGIEIDKTQLAAMTGCEVVSTSASKGTGLSEAARIACECAEAEPFAAPPHIFSEAAENALSQIEELIKYSPDGIAKRWFAIQLFQRDGSVLEHIKLKESAERKIDEIISECEKNADDTTAGIISSERYEYVAKIIEKCVCRKNVGAQSASDKIDGVLTGKIWGLPIFAAIMFLVYFVSIQTVGTALTDWVNDGLFGEIIPPAVNSALESANVAPWLSSLLLDGIIAGVGAVLGFLPQMLVLFLCLAILEDCGYMARIAFIMDRIFRRFGLSGKSFIPMLISTGCGVPGIMASRTIENENDRRITVITTTFMPCGAKLPIIALIAGAIFSESPWVAPACYFIGIGAVLVSGIILKKMKQFSGKPAPFVMELPTYHAPKASGVLKTTWDRGLAFIKKAGTIILLSTVAVWFLSSFDTSFNMVETNDSLLADLGRAIAPIFAPLGWGEWRETVATITGLVAKENVVGIFGVLFGFGEVAENGIEVWANLQAALTPLTAFSFLLFNLLAAPCFAAIGAGYRELGTVKWSLFSVCYQTLFAYSVSLIVYQVGMLITAGVFGAATLAAFVVLAILLYLLLRKPYERKMTLCAEKNG